MIQQTAISMIVLKRIIENKVNTLFYLHFNYKINMTISVENATKVKPISIHCIMKVKPISIHSIMSVQ